MKAITVRQPWASLIAEGVKTIETRAGEHPWRSAIGQTIAIHASAKSMRIPKFPTREGQRREPNSAEIAVHDLGLCECGHPALQCLRYGLTSLPLGAVVATCRLVDVIPMTESWGQTDCLTIVRFTDGRPDTLAVRHGEKGEQIEWVTDQQPFGDFAPGRWALLLDNVAKLPEPIPARGRQGLWTREAP